MQCLPGCRMEGILKCLVALCQHKLIKGQVDAPSLLIYAPMSLVVGQGWSCTVNLESETGILQHHSACYSDAGQRHWRVCWSHCSASKRKALCGGPEIAAGLWGQRVEQREGL